MSWTIHALENGLGAHADAWDRLNANLFDANPYFDSRFVDALLRHFAGRGERLCVHRASAGIDAMLIVTVSGLGRWSLFAPAQSQIAPLLVQDARALSSLMGKLPGPVFSLEMPCQEPQRNPLAARPAGMPMLAMDHVTTMAVRIDGPFEGYWKARSASLAKAIARRLRRVRDDGHAITLVHRDDSGAMRAATIRFGEMESQGWKGRGGTAIHDGNVQGAFYAQLMASFSMRRQASVYELYFGEVLVAMQLCIVSDSMLVLLKTTYNEQYAHYAPGRLLLHQLLQREFARRRVRTVEFYTNADRDQLSWATDQRMIRHFMLFRNSLARTGYCWLHNGWGRFKRGLTQAGSANRPGRQS
ncbi:hypothetical protein AAKU55_001677 [Oxalobacteraceae bacterium GrIS 1.11]